MVWVNSIDDACGLMARSPPKILSVGGLTKKLRVEGAMKLSSLIESAENLEELTINANGIQSEGALYLAKALEGNHSLKKLNLFDNQIGNQGAFHISRALQVNSTLESIDLGWNGINGQGALHLVEALKQNSALKALKLPHNVLPLSFATAMKDILETRPNIKNLDLQGALGDEESVCIFISAIESVCHLVELNLSGNHMGDRGAIKLAQILEKDTTPLQILNLSECSIGQAGMIRLAEAIKVNTTVKELNLRYNQSMNAGAFKFAEALEQNRCLENLDICSNQIKAEGGIRLADAISKNSTLRIFGLGHNMIESAGAIAIAKALRSNQCLQQLNLEANEICQEAVPHLVKAIQEHKIVRKVFLSMNQLSLSDHNLLEQAVQRNAGWKTASDLFVLVDGCREGYFNPKQDVSGMRLRSNSQLQQQPASRAQPLPPAGAPSASEPPPARTLKGGLTHTFERRQPPSFAPSTWAGSLGSSSSLPHPSSTILNEANSSSSKPKILPGQAGSAGSLALSPAHPACPLGASASPAAAPAPAAPSPSLSPSTFPPSFSTPSSSSSGACPASPGRGEEALRAVQFFKILQHPLLHYDLREMICMLSQEKRGFLPPVLLSRSREATLGSAAKGP